MAKIALFLADGFEEVEAVTPADFLVRGGVEVITAGITAREVTGGHNISIMTDCLVADLPRDLDGVIIPGGMPGAENVAASDTAMTIIKDLFQKGKLVAAICAAPAVVLEKAGILVGKKATCYPGFEKQFTQCIFSEDRVVIDGNLVTSRGPGTAAEFAIALVEILAGKEKALAIHQGTLQK